MAVLNWMYDIQTIRSDKDNKFDFFENLRRFVKNNTNKQTNFYFPRKKRMYYNRQKITP